MDKLKHFFGLDGARVDESRYFKANGSIILLFSAVLPFAQSTTGAVIFFIILVLFLVVLLLTSAERLKDIGKSRMWLILFFVPTVNIVLFFYLLLTKGKQSIVSP